jgi:acetolactate synthase I/III small subunit
MKAHTFVVTVEDLPGVLNRISSLFRRRGFNIESLTVGHTERPGVSRMTFVVLTDQAGAERFAAHLYKLVNVISVQDITAHPAVFRELAMIKVTAPQERRPEIVHLVEVFRARIVDLAPDSLTIEITGNEDKIDGLVDVLRPYGLIEMARTGRLAMTRASRSQAAAAARPAGDSHDPQVSYSV